MAASCWTANYGWGAADGLARAKLQLLKHRFPNAASLQTAQEPDVLRGRVSVLGVQTGQLRPYRLRGKNYRQRPRSLHQSGVRWGLVESIDDRRVVKILGTNLIESAPAIDDVGIIRECCRQRVKACEQ